MLSDEIGGGFIRDDVQQAIQRELDYRLGEADVIGALSRRDKELIALAINVAKPNACLSQLHARAAVKAGATREQVRDASMAPVIIGMIRWKMAGMGAFLAAEEELRTSHGADGSRQTGARGEDPRVADIRRHVRQVLHVELPDMWQKLAEVAPGVLDGYMRMRADIVKPDSSGGSLPKKIVELMIVSYDILQENSWGAQLHAGQAVRDGATVSEMVETVALAVIEAGVPNYKNGGLEAIQAAEEAAARPAG